MGDGDPLRVLFFNDLVRPDGETTELEVSPSLARLFAYAHRWGQKESPSREQTLTFSSMLAAMTAGDDPVCKWLRDHLALRGVSLSRITRDHPFAAEHLADRVNTTSSFRS